MNSYKKCEQAKFTKQAMTIERLWVIVWLVNHHIDCLIDWLNGWTNDAYVRQLQISESEFDRNLDRPARSWMGIERTVQSMWIMWCVMISYHVLQYHVSWHMMSYDDVRISMIIDQSIKSNEWNEWMDLVRGKNFVTFSWFRDFSWNFIRFREFLTFSWYFRDVSLNFVEFHSIFVIVRDCFLACAH